MNNEKKGATAPAKTPATSFGPQRPRYLTAAAWNLLRDSEREVLVAFASKKSQLKLSDIKSKATKRTVQLALANLVKAKLLVRVERGLYRVA